jgi:hypothetical protein
MEARAGLWFFGAVEVAGDADDCEFMSFMNVSLETD